MLPTALALAFLVAQAPEIPVLDGAKLEKVPGPQAPTYPDQGPSDPRPDIQAQIRHKARTGALTARAVPQLPMAIEDSVGDIAGWKAYRVEAPPGATVKARLHGLHEAWFAVHTVNHWGRQEQGMLQNRIPTGNPEASFINPKQEKVTFFFLVDTREMNAEREPYRLEITLK